MLRGWEQTDNVSLRQLQKVPCCHATSDAWVPVTRGVVLGADNPGTQMFLARGTQNPNAVLIDAFLHPLGAQSHTRCSGIQLSFKPQGASSPRTINSQMNISIPPSCFPFPPPPMLTPPLPITIALPEQLAEFHMDCDNNVRA